MKTATASSRAVVPAKSRPLPAAKAGSRKGKVAVAKVPAKAAASDSSLDDLLGGKIIPAVKKSRKEGKEKVVEKLPSEFLQLSDVFVAGKKIEREISFKVQYAENKIKEYCQERFAEKFAETGKRPKSLTYAGGNSVFTFIQTRRITLTPEKAEALADLDISLDGQTEIKGLHIDFAAIREHKLETKLRDALAGMGVSKAVLVECFRPDVQLKEAFFDHLSLVVSQSLKKGELLKDKILEALRILEPTEQIRNAEVTNLNAVQSYKLIHDADIVDVGDVEELEDSDGDRS